jgi:hypothetical protein
LRNFELRICAQLPVSNTFSKFNPQFAIRNSKLPLPGQELGKHIEVAGNIFLDQDLSGDREREIGFSTATSYAIRGEALKIGLETSYRNVSQPGDRRNAKNIFELGPSFTLKPSPHTRIDLAPLFGATNDSPHLELFPIFSIDFGTGAEREPEGPAPGGGRFQ